MKKKRKRAEKPLTENDYKFIDIYIATGNASQAVKEAYPEYTNASQAQVASKVTSTKKRILVAQEIETRRKALKQAKSGHIATGQEVMQYLTDVMEGKIKDQFGLDAPLSERTKAAQELAKRTVDFDNRIAGKADANINIKLDWSR